MRAVVFDLDDTLYKERDFLIGGFKAVARYVAVFTGKPVTAVYRILLGIYFAYGRDNTFGRLLGELGIQECCETQSLVEVYRTHLPQLELFDDARDVLLCLKQEKCLLGMITDGLDTVQKIKVAALGIESYFTRIIYTHEFGQEYYKPHPLSYVTMSMHFQCALKDMIYVGDNPQKDFVTARRLGMLTVRILRGPFAHVAVCEAYDAQIQINSFDGFLSWFHDLEKGQMHG